MDSNKQSFIAYRILQHPYLTSTTFLSWLQAISRKDLSMQMDGSRGIQNWYSISFCCRELTNELSQTRTRGGNLCTQFCDSDHMTCNRALNKESVNTVERFQESFQRQPQAVLRVAIIGNNLATLPQC